MTESLEISYAMLIQNVQLMENMMSSTNNIMYDKALYNIQQKPQWKGSNLHILLNCLEYLLHIKSLCEISTPQFYFLRGGKPSAFLVVGAFFLFRAFLRVVAKAVAFPGRVTSGVIVSLYSVQRPRNSTTPYLLKEVFREI
jgi:hypothetical protein